MNQAPAESNADWPGPADVAYQSEAQAGGFGQTLASFLRFLDLPENAAVLDVGTGSGVLAIAASQLGAKTVVAIDVDPDALASARENVDLNAARDRIALHELDLAAAAAVVGRRFDVILANLTGGLLCRDAASACLSWRVMASVSISAYERRASETYCIAAGTV